MTPAIVGFVVVALVGGAVEMASAFSGARKNRLDLCVGIALMVHLVLAMTLYLLPSRAGDFTYRRRRSLDKLAQGWQHDRETPDCPRFTHARRRTVRDYGERTGRTPPDG